MSTKTISPADATECVERGDVGHLGPVEQDDGPSGDPREWVRCQSCGHRWPKDD